MSAGLLDSLEMLSKQSQRKRRSLAGLVQN